MSDRRNWIIALVIAVVIAATSGYFLGRTNSNEQPTAENPGAQSPSAMSPAKTAGKGRILYYRNPMGLADTSPVPRKDAMGMDYVPVREGEDESGIVTVNPQRV